MDAETLERKQRGEFFPKQMKCDICGYEGSAQQVGGHIAREHGSAIRSQLIGLIESSGSNGITGQALASATGWNRNRISRFTTKLSKMGLITSVNRGQYVLAEYQPAVQAKQPRKPRAAKSTKSTKSKVVGSRLLNPRKDELTSTTKLLDVIDRNNSRIVKRAKQAAHEALFEQHSDEWVRFFVQALAEQQVASLKLQDLESLAVNMLVAGEYPQQALTAARH